MHGIVRANAPLGKAAGVVALNTTSAPTRIAFRYFNSSPEVIRLAVLMYVKCPLLLRSVEDLLHERGIDISHETVRYWWNRFGPLFAGDIRRQRASCMRGYRQWQWHLERVRYAAQP